jgi:hypothetical protein
MIGGELGEFGDLLIDESDAPELVSCEPTPRPESNSVSVSEATDENGNPHIKLRVSLQGPFKRVPYKSQKRGQCPPTSPTTSPTRKRRRRNSDASGVSTGTTVFDVERPHGTSSNTGVPEKGEEKGGLVHR